MKFLDEILRNMNYSMCRVAKSKILDCELWKARNNILSHKDARKHIYVYHIVFNT